MAETPVSPEGQSASRSPDLFESFKDKSIAELAPYTLAFNILVQNGERKGILIGYLDMEKESPKKVKVLIDGEFEYWTDEQTAYVGAQNRQWEENK